MQNAHLRLARLEYTRNSVKTQTHISVHVSHFIGENEQAHLLSLFGNDAEVGAVTAAVQENHYFNICTLDGEKQRASFGAEASVYKANLNLAGWKRSIRHVVVVSSWLRANGSTGRTFLLNDDEDEYSLAWATLVSFQGLPADPSWGTHLMGQLRSEGKLKPLFGIGCSPVMIEATREDLLDRIGRARSERAITFPATNGPIMWPTLDMRKILAAAVG